jgi:hypothetical protein
MLNWIDGRTDTNSSWQLGPYSWQEVECRQRAMTMQMCTASCSSNTLSLLRRTAHILNLGIIKIPAWCPERDTKRHPCLVEYRKEALQLLCQAQGQPPDKCSEHSTCPAANGSLQAQQQGSQAQEGPGVSQRGLHDLYPLGFQLPAGLEARCLQLSSTLQALQRTSSVT